MSPLIAAVNELCMGVSQFVHLRRPAAAARCRFKREWPMTKTTPDDGTDQRDVTFHVDLLFQIVKWNILKPRFFLNNTPSLFVGQIFICGDR
jgi:hypothetical protein